MGWCGSCGGIKGGDSLSFLVDCCRVWYAVVWRAETCFECCLLWKEALNTKIGGIIHEDVALLLGVFSLDSELACKFYESLSEEWSAATQKEEQRLRTSPRVTILVRTK
jgi:hypothetical protein